MWLDGDLGDPGPACRDLCRRCGPRGQRLAKAKPVIKSLCDVETLAGTTVINSDKAGTTLNQMTATTMLAGGEWFEIEGGGYRKAGAILGVSGSSPSA